MPLASYKDLCLDAADAVRVGEFWAAAVGGELEYQANGDTALRGPSFGPLWVNGVPEPKVVKNRVHLDLRGPSVDALVALGATVLADHREDGDGWVVLGDPEGNECCLFPGEVAGGAAPAEVFALCVDSDAPVELAAWWHAVLGGAIGPGSDGAPRWLHGAAGFGDVIMKFVPVGDVRVAKNRSHWDVDTDDVAALIAHGATLLAEPGTGHPWTVLADPQGNEFCAFTPT